MKNYVKLILVCAVILLSSQCKPSPKAVWKWPKTYPTGDGGERVRYGEQLVDQTPFFLGPQASSVQLRLARNHLACSDCHAQNGKQVNAVGFIGLSHRYPAYYAPLGKEITLEERISACFQRSLNGQPLPKGKELNAFVAYINWLSQEIPKGEIPPGSGLPEITFPQRKADLGAGKKLYAYHCAACHQTNGSGLKAPQGGYTFPPLWGNDSYTQSSSLGRLSTLSRYIKANMPLNRPVLSEAEAYDLAAYLNAQNRPQAFLLSPDYPDTQTRPVDAQYGFMGPLPNKK